MAFRAAVFLVCLVSAGECIRVDRARLKEDLLAFKAGRLKNPTYPEAATTPEAEPAPAGAKAEAEKVPAPAVAKAEAEKVPAPAGAEAEAEPAPAGAEAEAEPAPAGAEAATTPEAEPAPAGAKAEAEPAPAGAKAATTPEAEPAPAGAKAEAEEVPAPAVAEAHGLDAATGKVVVMVNIYRCSAADKLKEEMKLAADNFKEAMAEKLEVTITPFDDDNNRCQALASRSVCKGRVCKGKDHPFVEIVDKDENIVKTFCYSEWKQAETEAQGSTAGWFSGK